MNTRSSESLGIGHQLYRVIEFCRDPQTLWSKLESGKWDWLGVYPERNGKVRFVVGRPRVQRMEARGALTVSEKEGSSKYRVEERVPRGPAGGNEYANAAAAREGFRKRVEQIRNSSAGSGLFRVRLVIDDEEEDREFIVVAEPNVL